MYFERSVRTFAIGLALSLVTIPAWSNERAVQIVIEPWAPFAHAELPGGGFLTRLTQAAFEAGGRESQVHFAPWARALQEVAHGHRDVLMGLFHSEEREALYRYSEPVYEVEVGLVALRGFERESYESLDELTEYRIGIGRGFANSPEFDAAVDEGLFDVYVATDHATHVRMLFAGRLDMIAGTVDTIRHAARLSGHSPAELLVLQPPLKVHDIHIGVSRAIEDSEQIRDDFNDGLQRIRETGLYDEILATSLATD